MPADESYLVGAAAGLVAETMGVVSVLELVLFGRAGVGVVRIGRVPWWWHLARGKPAVVSVGGSQAERTHVEGSANA